MHRPARRTEAGRWLAHELALLLVIGTVIVMQAVGRGPSVDTRAPTMAGAPLLISVSAAPPVAPVAATAQVPSMATTPPGKRGVDAT